MSHQRKTCAAALYLCVHSDWHTDSASAELSALWYVEVHDFAIFPKRSLQYVVHAEADAFTAVHLEEDAFNTNAAGETYTVVVPMLVLLYVADTLVHPDTVGTNVN